MYENKHLRELITELKNKVSALQGVIYGMKLNRIKTKKKPRHFKEVKPKPIPEPVEIKPEKTIDKEPVYVSPFAGKEFKSHNYAGYIEHQII